MKQTLQWTTSVLASQASSLPLTSILDRIASLLKRWEGAWRLAAPYFAHPWLSALSVSGPIVTTKPPRERKR